MTAPLRPWLVRRSRFPFGIGELLGVVEARDRVHADELAAQQYARPFVLEPVTPGALKTVELPPRRPFVPRHFTRTR